MIDARNASGVPCITTARPTPPPEPTFEAFGIRFDPWQKAFLASVYIPRIQHPNGGVIVTGVGS